MVRHLTLREALACDRLAEFVRQAEARDVELSSGSDFERAPFPTIASPRRRPCPGLSAPETHEQKRRPLHLRKNVRSDASIGRSAVTG